MKYDGIIAKKMQEVKQYEKKTIVLPEAEDIRILKAAQIVVEHNLAKIILIGNKQEIEEKCKAEGII